VHEIKRGKRTGWHEKPRKIYFPSGNLTLTGIRVKVMEPENLMVGKMRCGNKPRRIFSDETRLARHRRRTVPFGVMRKQEQCNGYDN